MNPAATWLAEQERNGCSTTTLDQYRKTIAWAERRTGCELVDAGPEQWERFAAGARLDPPRLRILRRFLTWASRPIPSCLRDGTTGTPGRHGPAPKARRMNAEWRQPIADWLTWVGSSSVSSGTLTVRRHQIHALAEHFHPLGPWDITPTRLAAYLGGRGWARETMRGARSAIRSFYGWAHASGLIGTDPSRLLRRIPARSYQPRPAGDDAIAEGLASADERVYLMLMLGARCGLRCVEISRLHTDDVTRAPGGWFTLAVLGKGDRRRNVPIPDDVAAAIRQRPQGWVFSNGQGHHMTAGHVSKLMNAALPDGITAHMLRHRYASTSYAATRDLRAVQLLLGHASPAVTQIYTRITDDQVHAAAVAASKIG